jgi:hypothetical protein
VLGLVAGVSLGLVGLLVYWRPRPIAVVISRDFEGEVHLAGAGGSRRAEIKPGRTLAWKFASFRTGGFVLEVNVGGRLATAECGYFTPGLRDEVAVFTIEKQTVTCNCGILD